jgi:hypothetical protein
MVLKSSEGDLTTEEEVERCNLSFSGKGGKDENQEILAASRSWRGGEFHSLTHQPFEFSSEEPV